MARNATLPAKISSAQELAVAALVSGSTITEAAEKAGVSRETCSRWVHRDPAFIAEVQNQRAELAAAVRCELASLGKQAVAVVRETLTNESDLPTRYKAAVDVLKMLGAADGTAVEPTTAREVSVKLRDREQSLNQDEDMLDVFNMIGGKVIDDMKHDADEALAATGNN